VFFLFEFAVAIRCAVERWAGAKTEAMGFRGKE
jgi:hypothetical protein